MKKSLVIILPIVVITASAVAIGIASKIKGESLFKEIISSKNEKSKEKEPISLDIENIDDADDSEIKIDDNKIEDELPTIE